MDLIPIVTIPLRIGQITRLEFGIGRTAREWDEEEQRRGWKRQFQGENRVSVIA
jgi:hypothetical protein